VERFVININDFLAWSHGRPALRQSPLSNVAEKVSLKYPPQQEGTLNSHPVSSTLAIF